MKILILTQPEKYKYHKEYGEKIRQILSEDCCTDPKTWKSNDCGFDVRIIDIDSYSYDHICLKEISDSDPDVIITLDLAGFRFMTQSGEPALNMLYSKNLNLLWQSPSEYAPLLTGKKISLSMIFFDMKIQEESLTDIYPNIDYYIPFENILSSKEGISSAEIYSFEEIFSKVWTDFVKEVFE